ncbi:MAG: hypothetical protein JSW33_12290 [bacterium]|nr:MAG: hypothetical protein JSW33_12290 [bacterium]
MLMISENGREWSDPEKIFPEYSLPGISYTEPESGQADIIPDSTKAVMHQRLGFYITNNNRLLTLDFTVIVQLPASVPTMGRKLAGCFGRMIRMDVIVRYNLSVIIYMP